MLIHQDLILPMLIEACPSFTERLRESLEFFEGEPVTYPHIGEFAHHLVGLWQTGQTDEFNAVFDLIEKLHIEGDPNTKEIAAIGFLESIQNVSGNSGVDPEEFVGYLQPTSREWWYKLNDFWDGKTSCVGGPPVQK